MKRLWRTRNQGMLIAGVMLFTILVMSIWGGGKTITPEAAAAEGSPYHNPWEWPDGSVACFSALNIQDNRIPFDFYILHPPSKERSMIDAAIQELPEQNQMRHAEPWPDEMMARYLVISTRCYDNWAELYKGWNHMQKSEIYALLPSGQDASESEIREAILRVRFPENYATANRMFPHTAEILSSMRD